MNSRVVQLIPIWTYPGEMIDKAIAVCYSKNLKEGGCCSFYYRAALQNSADYGVTEVDSLISVWMIKYAPNSA